MASFFPVNHEVLEPSFVKPRINIVSFFFTLWIKARRMPNLERMWALVQRLYSEEFKSSGESCTVEASEVSEVSVLSTLRSDTCLGSIPSFFIRVMSVVRLVMM